MKRKYKIMWIILAVLAALAVAVVIFINQPSFGRHPREERLERIGASPNYRDGQFRNLRPTEQLTSDKGFLSLLSAFLFGKNPDLRPEQDLPTVKTDLTALPREEDTLVWLGHGSYYMQIEGRRIMVDPVLIAASPVSFFNKPFKGTDIYKPEDIPAIDYLIITHDHWDHLDYATVKNIRDRVGKVICPLGVGEHFEYWGYEKDRVIEKDWYESFHDGEGFGIYFLPARHFSGRGLRRNPTLWASYLIETPSRKIYLSGDGGYDSHFVEIAHEYGPIDLAVMENGQYNEDWRFIHLLPEDLRQAIRDIGASKVITVHHSKYALARHSWYEPLENAVRIAGEDSVNIITPMIGEPVRLWDDHQVFGHWWTADGR